MSLQPKSLINVIVIIAGLFFFILSMHLPLSLWTSSIHDDQYFISKGYSIVSGQWLSDFDNLTLIKGPTYSIYLAISSLLGLPITLTTAITFVLMVIYVTRISTGFGVGKYCISFLAILLFLNPAFLPTRVIRDNLYYILSIVVLLSFIQQFSFDRNKHGGNVTFIAGAFLGLFWCTREEGVWIIPPFALVFFYGIWRTPSKDRLMYVKKLLIYFIACLVVVGFFCTINYYKYGVFTVVDFKNKGFVGALDALNGIDTGDEVLFVPVSKSKRDIAYSISPSFRELKGYFEGPGKNWTEHGCNYYPHTCGDYAGGWFMWALRDAAQSIGKYKSAQIADNFYQSIADEIKDACIRSIIRCHSKNLPFFPVISIENIKLIPRKIIDVFEFAVNKGDVNLTAGKSSGDANSVRKAQRFLGNPRRTLLEDEEIHTYAGWFVDNSGGWISLECEKNSQLIQIPRKESIDLNSAFNRTDLKNNRFSVSIGSSNKCKFINSDGKIVYDIQVEKGSSDNLSNSYHIHFDKIETSPELLYYNEAITVKKLLIKIYAIVMPILALIGVVSFLILSLKIVGRLNRLDDLAIASLCLWAAFFSRCLLILMVDISSFPALFTHYMLPAIIILPFACIYSVCALFNMRTDLAKPQLKEL